MSMWESLLARLPGSAFYQVINIPGRVKSKIFTAARPWHRARVPPPAICLLIPTECALSSPTYAFCRQHQSRFSGEDNVERQNMPQNINHQ
jgi:hypothetical protein